MANYEHGVYVSETDTALIPSVEVDSAIPFVVGCAPVNLVSDPKINEPILINSASEAVAAVGYEAPIEGENGKRFFRYSLSEFYYVNFNLYAIVPCVFVNVLDPDKHKTDAETTAVTLSAKGSATIEERGLILSSVKISSGETSYTADTDYSLAFDDDGFLVVSSLTDDDGAYLLPVSTELTVSAEKLDPTQVTASDIIGGIDAATGKKKGLEAIADVYPKLGVIPTLVLCPGFSDNTEVATIMGTKVSSFNGHFNALAVVDAPADTIKTYSDVPSWKDGNSIDSKTQVVCWPMAFVDDIVTHLSSHFVGVAGVTDGDNDSVPYNSPSNKDAEITGLCLADGSEVIMGPEEANYMNGQGLVTALNFIGGWRIWGNRTACYPGNTDPKDAFIPVRRMFDWITNRIVLTIWQEVDEPGNRRLIDSVTTSIQVWLNSLTSRQQLLGGTITFREEDNSTTDMMDGKYTFKVSLTPPSPARALKFNLEIDTSLYSTLFS